MLSDEFSHRELVEKKGMPKLGTGARFRALSARLAAKGTTNPDALAAWIGRKKYGSKFAALSRKGKKRLKKDDFKFSSLVNDDE